MTTIVRSELILGGQKSGKSRRAELLARQWLQQSSAHRAVLIATAQAWDEEMRLRIERHQRERAERVPGMLTLEEPRDLAAALTRVSSPQALVVVDCLTLWLTNWLMPAVQAPHPSPGAGRETLPPFRLSSSARAELEPQPSAPEGRGRSVAPDLLPLPLGEGGGEGRRPVVKHVKNQEKRSPAPDWQAQAASFLIAIENAPGPVVLVGNEIGLGVIPLGREVRAFVDALGGLNQQVAAVCERVTLMAAGLPLSLKTP